MLQKINHIGIAVQSIEATLPFYRDTLGMTCLGLEEVRYYLILVNDLGYGCTKKHHEMLDEVGRMLDAYSASILTSVS